MQPYYHDESAGITIYHAFEASGSAAWYNSPIGNCWEVMPWQVKGNRDRREGTNSRRIMLRSGSDLVRRIRTGRMKKSPFVVDGRERCGAMSQSHVQSAGQCLLSGITATVTPGTTIRQIFGSCAVAATWNGMGV